MKKKLLAGVLALALAVTSVVAGPVVSANAAEPETNDVKTSTISGYYLDGVVVDKDDYYELATGDYTHCVVDLYTPDGEAVDPEKWDLVSQDKIIADKGFLLFHSDSETPDAIIDNDATFSDEIPESAFGHYIYRVIGAYLKDDPSNILYGYIRSKFRTVAWVNGNYTVASQGDGKSVRVWSVWNSSKKNLSFASSVKINGKKYVVNEIGDNAFEDSASSITEVTLPSSITTIGKNSFAKATKLKTITIKGNLKKVGKKAFSNINKKATFKIKANEKNFNKIVKLLKKGGAPKNATFKRI